MNKYTLWNKRAKNNLARYSFFLFLFIIILSGCGKQPKELNISAAASMGDVFTQIQKIYSQKNKDVKLSINLGASGTLQRQIEQGAPVDIFFSAGVKEIDELEEKDLLAKDSRQNLLKNRIVLVSSPDVTISDFSDLQSDLVKKIAYGNPSSAPVGQYTEQSLHGLGIMEGIKDKIVYAKDAKEALMWIETGNVDAGFVFGTDLYAGKAKLVKEVPEDLHNPIIYPIAIIKSSDNQEEANDFIDFLKSDDCQKIFIDYGFEPIG